MIVAAFGLLVFLGPRLLLADDATHIWISTSNVATSGPPPDASGVPVVDTVLGSTRYLDSAENSSVF
jgi:hypothetical protein